MGSQSVAGNWASSHLEVSGPQNTGFATAARRQTELLAGAVADADTISGVGKERVSEDSKGLNTAPIVWICVVLLAVLILIMFCILGQRRQNRRDELAGVVRAGKEQSLP